MTALRPALTETDETVVEVHPPFSGEMWSHRSILRVTRYIRVTSLRPSKSWSPEQSCLFSYTENQENSVIEEMRTSNFFCLYKHTSAKNCGLFLGAIAMLCHA